MKRTIYYFLFCLIFLFPNYLKSATSQLEVPKYVTLQAVVTDDGGNVLYDRMDATITFWILDGAGIRMGDPIPLGNYRQNNGNNTN